MEGRSAGLCLAGGDDCRRHEGPDVLHCLSAVNLAIERCGGEVVSDSFDFDGVEGESWLIPEGVDGGDDGIDRGKLVQNVVIFDLHWKNDLFVIEKGLILLSRKRASSSLFVVFGDKV